MLILPHTLLQALKGNDPFEACMALTGETFRQLPERQTTRIVIGEKAYFIKQHQGIGYKALLKDLSAGRLPIVSAQTEWRALQHCVEQGISTTWPVGIGEKGNHPALKRSFLITEDLADIITLDVLLKQPLPFTEKQHIIRLLANTVRRLHHSGLNHRDLYLCHFALKKGESYPLYVLDLHRAQIRKCVPFHAQVKDLSALLFSSFEIGVSKKLILYFIRHYTEQPLKVALQDPLWKIVWQRAEKKKNHTLYLLKEKKYTFFPEAFQKETCLRLLPGKRAVYRGTYRGVPAILKIFYKKRGWGARLLHKSPYFMYEMRRHQLLKEKNISIPALFAWGDNWLIFEDLNPAMSLKQMMEIPEQKKPILKNALIFLAKCHNAGIQLQDVHGDNFLVKKNNIYWVDLGAVHMSQGQVSFKKGLQECALFLAQWPRSQLADYFPELLNDYLKARGTEVYSLSQFQNLIAQQWRNRERKVLEKTERNCSAVAVYKSFSRRVVYAKSVVDENFKRFLGDIDQAFAHKEAVYLKKGRTATVIRFTSEQNTYVIKRYNIKSSWQVIKSPFCSSRAQRAWKMSHWLTLYGIPCAQPIAYIEKRAGVFKRETYFVSRFVSDQDFYRTFIELNAWKSEHATIAEALCQIIQQLHQAHFIHGDMKASNILLRGQSPVLIDVESIQHCWFNWKKLRGIQKGWERFLKNWDKNPRMYHLFQEKMAESINHS